MTDGPLNQDTVLQVLWNRIETGLVLYGSGGEQLMANPAAKTLMGGEHSRVTGRVVYLADGMLVCPESEWPLHRALTGEIVRNEELVVCDERHPEGRRMMVTAYPVPLADDSIGALVAIFDTTDRWRDDQANRTSLDQLTMMLNGAEGYAILQLGPRGEVLTWSDNAQRVLGYSREEILGQRYSLFFLPDERINGVPEAILATAHQSGSAQTHGSRQRGDGSSFWADGVLTAIRDRDGEVTGFVKVIHDVTSRYEAERAVDDLNRELRELNEELEERVRERTALLEGRTAALIGANAELEAFSYSVSHDLRAPVRAVHGFSRIVRQRYSDVIPAEGQAFLERIEQSAIRMGELIDALLRLSRMQRQPMTVRPVDMAELIGRCWEVLLEEQPGRTCELTVGPLDIVDADPHLLRQVWMNLLENAVKYTAGTDHPEIAISSTPDGDQITFTITDNGAGFDPRYADKLFKVFQRLHAEEDFEGIGIGLAIVHRAVLRHGGTVWASSAPGQGATFSFTLPRSAHGGVGGVEAVVDHVG